ncbi:MULTISPECIES: hypothetical protein [Haloferacaceae]|uniref:Uncharacterized protein n=1 Tax=Halorubrum glutamatedens TaxID=2707018 RepID=A0ABD5QVN5_9EURY|nr:hypothetical protein [Halobellus captivus]
MVCSRQSAVSRPDVVAIGNAGDLAASSRPAGREEARHGPIHRQSDPSTALPLGPPPSYARVWPEYPFSTAT